jgi:acyl-ACP thioesterase
MEVKEETFRIRTFDCGADGNIHLYALMQYMQEIAAGHADELGFGFERMSEMNAYWVLSNIGLEIARLPQRDENLTIKTWPSGYSRTVATREFVGHDNNNDEIFRAGSDWMVLNRKTNKLRNLFRLDLDLPKTGQKVLSERLRRLEPCGDYKSIDRTRVPYSAIDLNGHVNNTEYVRWGVDALRRAFPSTKAVRSLQVTYLSEIFDGDEIMLSVSSNDENEISVLGQKAGVDNIVYLMQVFC